MIRYALGLTVLTAALAGCGKDPAARGAKEDKAPRPVKTGVAATGSLERVVKASGTLAADDEAVLGAKVAGQIASLEVDLGSAVAADQPLAKLVAIDFELRLAQATAALEQARARLGLAPGERASAIDPARTSVVRQATAARDDARVRRDRARALFARELLPQSELDTAESAFNLAEARLDDARDEVRNRQALVAQRESERDLARQQLRDAVLTAPFSGTVGARHVATGEYVSAGQSIVTLVRVDPLRLRLEIPEREAGGIRAGQAVRLSVSGEALAHEGRVARLSPTIAESSRTLLIEAEVPNPKGTLRPGAFATVEIVVASGEPAVLAPAAALVTFAGVDRMLAVVDGKTVEKRVKLGRRVGDALEILEGLEAGARVVLDPGSLVGGEPVVETE